MRVSTATTTNKRVFSLNKIKGVDLSSAPLRVKETRASYMRNMICKDGANHKRNGFYDVASFFDSTSGEPLPINGIYPYQKDGVKYKVVHAGSNLYRCSEDFSVKKPITIPAGISLGIEKSQGFVDDGKLYIIANGSLLVLDGLKLYSLFNNERAYVPTTSIAITDTEHGSLLEPFEGVNLFSKKRINKLTGAKNGKVETIEDIPFKSMTGSKGVFYLDGEVDFDKDVIIKARIFINGVYDVTREDALQLNAYYEDNHSTTNGYVDVKFTVKSEGAEADGSSFMMVEGEEKEIIKFVESFSEQITIDKFKVSIKNVDGKGEVTFTPALPSPVLGEDNITIEYSTKKTEPSVKMAQCYKSSTFGNMLVIVTDDDMVYYSHPSYGFNYIPDNNYLKLADAYAITAIVPGNDFLAVCGSWQSAIVTFNVTSDNDKISVVPTLVKRHMDAGCINNLAFATLESDTIIVNRKGVFGIGTSDIYMRSSNINKELNSYSEEELEKAVGVVCDGRYYLFVSEKVYVADARYKSYESNRLDVSFEYEWWVWDNCPCRVAIKENEQILIGREDGYIVTQGEGYVDTTSYELGEGEILLDGLNSFTFNDELNVNESDELRITGAYEILTLSAVSNTQFVKIDESTAKLILPAAAYRAVKNYLYTKIDIVCIDWDTLEPTGQYNADFIDIVPEEHAIIINHPLTYIPTLEEERILFCINTMAHQVVYSPVKLSNGTYRLESERGGAYFYQYGESIGAILTRKKPVECEMHSAVVSLGSDVLNKTIHKLVFVPSIETQGNVKIGYETINNNQVKPQLVSSALDFNKIDFNEFSFDASFYKRYEKRVHERKVELIKFKFLSADDKDFCIEQFSCIYSINGR